MSRPIALLTPRIDDQIRLVQGLLDMGYFYFQGSTEAWRRSCSRQDGTSAYPLTYTSNDGVYSTNSGTALFDDTLYVNSIDHFLVAARRELIAYQEQGAANRV